MNDKIKTECCGTDDCKSLSDEYVKAFRDTTEQLLKNYLICDTTKKDLLEFLALNIAIAATAMTVNTDPEKLAKCSLVLIPTHMAEFLKKVQDDLPNLLKKLKKAKNNMGEQDTELDDEKECDEEKP